MVVVKMVLHFCLKYFRFYENSVLKTDTMLKSYACPA